MSTSCNHCSSSAAADAKASCKACADKLDCGWVKDSKASFVVQPDGKAIDVKNFPAEYYGLPTLCYFEGRGRAEVTRFMYMIAGQKWIDCRVPQEEFKTLWKSKLPFGQLPWLCISHDFQFAQSRAIEKYVATYAGLNGRDPKEQAQIDQIVEATTDLLTPFFVATMAVRGDEKKIEEAATTYFRDTFPIWANYLSKQLGEKKYFVGDRLTYADVQMFASLGVFVWDKPEAHAEKNFPKNLQDHFERIAAIPAVAQWIKQRPASQF